MYTISFVETLGNMVIFNFPIWVEIKPVLTQSLLTFIAFDRFLKYILEGKNGIVSDIKYISSLSILDNIKSNFSDEIKS